VYDKLVSVEMIEAVGTDYLESYFRVCSERLRPDGRMLLQAIMMVDRNYAWHARSVDFIRKYVFPGGALPSLGAIMHAVCQVTDMQLVDVHDIGFDYARTLKAWRERFTQRLDDVRRMGYPEQFIRMWHYYLCYCEGAFRERAITDAQIVFDKPAMRSPPRPAMACADR